MCLLALSYVQLALSGSIDQARSDANVSIGVLKNEEDTSLTCSKENRDICITVKLMLIYVNLLIYLTIS